MNNNNNLKRLRFQNAIETGHWWCHPWWQDETYYEKGVYSRELAKIAFSELRLIYNEKWMLRNIRKKTGNLQVLHPAANILLPEGLSPFATLYSLGHNLYVARKENLIDDDLVRRLTNPTEYWEAACFELKLLSLFLDHGYKVERNYCVGKGKKGKSNCDLKVTKEHETIYIEIKRPHKIHRDNEAVMLSAAYEVISRAMKDTVDPSPPIAKPLSSKKEIEKVFRWIREATKKQLPDKGLGVVIVESPLVMPSTGQIQAIADRRFRNRGIYSPLSAAVLIDSYLDKDGIRNNVNIICNPHARVDVSTYESLKLLSSLSR